MSSFIELKRDVFNFKALKLEYDDHFSNASSRLISGIVRQRIKRSGERLWRLDDFRNLPFAAVAQVLSRLTRQGTLERLSKGVYYCPCPTAFGKSRPEPAAIQKLASRRKTVFPSGIAAIRSKADSMVWTYIPLPHRSLSCRFSTLSGTDLGVAISRCVAPLSSVMRGPFLGS
jgi:hypothetical protein